jgi:adenylate kinase
MHSAFSTAMPEHRASAMTPKSIVVILLGPPGCGKGTQARELSRTFGFVHLSTGDMLRFTAAEDSELGRAVRATMDAGKLVSDDLICRSVAERIAPTDRERGLVLDGFPRTLEQARFLSTALGNQKVLALNLQVSRDLLLRRILGRLTCPDCGDSYNLFFRAPSREGVCDLDGAQLKRRADDDEAVIRQRLAVHEKETQPLVEYFRARNILEDIYADVDAATLSTQLHEKLQTAMETVSMQGRRK